MTAAERQRRWRERQKRGEAVIPISTCWFIGIPSRETSTVDSVGLIIPERMSAEPGGLQARPQLALIAVLFMWGLVLVDLP